MSQEPTPTDPREGELFPSGEPIRGVAGIFHCGKTGHDYVVIAPSIDALEGIAVIRLGYEALCKDSCQRVTIEEVKKP